MKDFLKQGIGVAVRLAFAAAVIVAVVIVARISYPDKLVIIHSGPLIVTGVEVTDHDSGNMCIYTLSQKDANDKVIKRFSYVTRCGMYHAAENLMLIHGRK